jgi:hypothetical protein
MRSPRTNQTSPTEPATRVLLRTARDDPDMRSLAQHLRQASGCPVTLVVDVRGGGADGSDVIALSSAACNRLGLHCPADFAWRCGDYGYYLARRRFPRARRFWLIEPDVAFFGGNAAEFFGFFAQRDQVDLLAAQLRPADHSWYWRQTARARDVAAYRCLFPITRLSARAIDAALARRRSHSRRLTRRLLWPNDEALVATTLMNSGLLCRDFNDFGTTFYSDEMFFFGAPLRGERLPSGDDGVRLAHPVLFGRAYEDKVAALTRAEAAPRQSRRGHRLAARLNAWSRW